VVIDKPTILTRDLNAFQQLYDDSLLALPSVLRLTSTLVMIGENERE
jgi:hypothetical protein